MTEIEEIAVFVPVASVIELFACVAAGVRVSDVEAEQDQWWRYIDVRGASQPLDQRPVLTVIVCALRATAIQRVGGLFPDDVFNAEKLWQDRSWYELLIDAMNAFARTIAPAARCPYDGAWWTCVLDEAKQILNDHASLALLWAGTRVLLLELDHADRRLASQSDASRSETLMELLEKATAAMRSAVSDADFERLWARVRAAEVRLTARFSQIIREDHRVTAKKHSPLN